MEDLGAKCLPCEVDIRDEQQLGQAIDEAVNKFGGIDILVNNAGAISLTNTDITSSKKLDLMIGVNLRGPYLWYVRQNSSISFLNSEYLLRYTFFQDGKILSLCIYVDQGKLFLCSTLYKCVFSIIHLSH